MGSTLFGLGNGRNLKLYPGSTVFQEKTSVSYASKAKIGTQVAIEYDALPKPGFRGDYPSIRISKKAYERGLDYCKHSLIGRMEMTEIDIEKLKSEAAIKWKPQGFWNITPLGKGFMHIKFDNGVDFDKVWSGGPWKFDGHLLRLSAWQKSFNPDSQKQTNALIWVKFPRLPLEFWDAESIMSIARGVGYPMKLDEATEKKKFGFYAHVLVDVDLSKAIPDQVFVEHDDGEFWQDVQITKLPKFCSHCKMVGHIVAECKKVRTEIDGSKGKETVMKKGATKGNEKEIRKGKTVQDQTIWKKVGQTIGSNISSTSVIDRSKGNELVVQKARLNGSNGLTITSVHQGNKFHALTAIEEYSDEEELNVEVENAGFDEEGEQRELEEMEYDMQEVGHGIQEEVARPIHIVSSSGTESNIELVNETPIQIGSIERVSESPRSAERLGATPRSAERLSTSPRRVVSVYETPRSAERVSDTPTSSGSTGKSKVVEEANAVLQLMMQPMDRWADLAEEEEIEEYEANTEPDEGNWYVKTKKGVVPIHDVQLSPMKIRSGKKIGVSSKARH